MSADAYLIVEQRSSPPPEMPELLKQLVSAYGLDGYNCRQLLLGQTEAFLTKGPTEQLDKIQNTLADYSFNANIITPSPLRFAPFMLTRIEKATNELRLHGREKQLVIPEGSRLLILLAELSGKLVERSLSHVLASHRYTGSAENSGLPTEKWQRTILQGRPVLDIYLLDDSGQPLGAVRAFPGKFDHKSLGERASLSSHQNLIQLMKWVQEYAGRHRVDMRFGLSPLPGASLQAAKENDLAGLKKNLRNLTRYAWLQTDIDAQRVEQAPASDAAEIAATTTGLLTAIHPELLASHPLQQQVVSELSKEIAGAAGEAKTAEPSSTAPKTLPTPPDALHHSPWQSPRTYIGFAMLGIFALLFKFGAAGSWLAPLLAKAVSSGVLSGIVAAGFLIAGFRLLQLKRIIENTPTSKIRSIAMGRVEVHGTARRQFALFSPMTNMACIYYRLTRYKRNQKNEWVVSSITSSGHVPFWLEDETGRVCVDPEAAKIKAGHRQESLADANVSFGGFNRADEKWVEEMIYDGALVYVLGQAQVKKSARPPRRQRRAEALRDLKLDRQKMAKYDSNGDGQIDEAEWQQARDEVDDKLLHEDLHASAERKRQEDQVVIGKPRQRGVPFVIAETASEDKLTSRYALGIGGLFSLALICCVVTIWLLLKNS